MKMRKTMALMLALVMSAACMAAPAAAAGTEPDPTKPPEVSGIYNLKAESGFTVTPKKAGDETAEEVKPADGAAYIDGAQVNNFYPEAEQLELTYTPESGRFHLVLAVNDGKAIPTEKNLVYIDQTAAADGVVSFRVFPSRLESGKTYTIFVTDETKGEAVKAAAFQYYAPYKLGDVDNNGKIDPTDALLALQHFVGSAKLDGTKKLAADVYKNDKVDPTDALMMLQHFVGSKKIEG